MKARTNRQQSGGDFMLWLQKQVMLTGRMDRLQRAFEEMSIAQTQMRNAVEALYEERADRMAEKSRGASGAQVPRGEWSDLAGAPPDDVPRH